MKQMQAQQPKKEQSERPRSSRRKLRCCGEEGHNLKACTMIQQNHAACVKQKAEKRVPNGANECQMVPEGARGCQQSQDGTFVAPILDKSSPLVTAEVTIAGVKGTGRSEEVEISRNITFSEKILIESCGI